MWHFWDVWLMTHDINDICPCSTLHGLFFSRNFDIHILSVIWATTLNVGSPCVIHPCHCVVMNQLPSRQMQGQLRRNSLWHWTKRSLPGVWTPGKGTDSAFAQWDHWIWPDSDPIHESSGWLRLEYMDGGDLHGLIEQHRREAFDTDNFRSPQTVYKTKCNCHDKMRINFKSKHPNSSPNPILACRQNDPFDGHFPRRVLAAVGGALQSSA